LFCCRYDPATGKYGVVIARLLQMAGLITVVSLAGLILSLSRSRKPAVGGL